MPLMAVTLTTALAMMSQSNCGSGFCSSPVFSPLSATLPHTKDSRPTLLTIAPASEPSTTPAMIKAFEDAAATRAADKAAGRFYLQSMAAGNPTKQLEYAALITYLPFIDKDKNEAKCAALFNIPG